MLMSVWEDCSGCSVERDSRKWKGGTNLLQDTDEEEDGWMEMVASFVGDVWGGYP